MIVHEETILVRSAVQGPCDLLGLDPRYVANEGVLLAVVAPAAAEDLVAEMRKTTAGADAFIAGEVTKSPPHTVLYKRKWAAGGSWICFQANNCQEYVNTEGKQ